MMDRGGGFMTEKERERKVFRYMARYGQHPETEKRYRDAIEACQNIGNLELTVSQIAREYGVKPECLRNQLKRHFPEVIPTREKLRDAMGLSRPGNCGLKKATVEKYAQAVQLLRNTSVTVREAATRCNVSYQALQQHLIYYHKDIAEQRMLSRTDALLRPAEAGNTAGVALATGGVKGPRPETRELFAPAVQLYKETDLTLPEIATRCKLSVHSVSSYIRRWHPEEVERRRHLREERQKAKRLEREHRPNQSPPYLARMRYEPAIALLQAGMTLSQAAKELNADLCNLSAWFKKNHPEILEETGAGMMVLPSGQKTLRRTYERFLPIAVYIETHPSKSTKELCRKFNVPVSSLVKYISTYFPEQWRRHCTACADKAARLRRRKKRAKN